MVNANGIKSWLTIPEVYTIGRNTQIVVIVDARIGPATCAVPLTAAFDADIPSFENGKYFHYYNGVIYEHTDTKTKPGQRHNVNINSRKIHDNNGK